MKKQDSWVELSKPLNRGLDLAPGALWRKKGEKGEAS